MSETYPPGEFEPGPVDVSFTRIGGPSHLPSLTEQERADLLAELRPWVLALRTRFLLDHSTIPDCWEQHPGMAEALAALRDAERGAYADTAPAGAGVEFLHAVHLVGSFLADQAGRSGCSGRTHREPLTPLS